MTAGFDLEYNRPRPLPNGYQPPGHFHLRGQLPAGEFEFERPEAGTPGVGRPGGVYYFVSVTAADAAFRLDDLSFYATDCRFRDCSFRQERRGPIGAHTGAQGSFGHTVRSYYEGCTFDHVDFGLQGGGFDPGDARFERCTFKYCSWRHFRSRRADFVDCRFTGVMQHAWFHGADPDDPAHVNEFTRNDLSGAKPRRVEFRTGLDARGSKLPEGPEYVWLHDFGRRIAAARVAVRRWPEEERVHAEAMLDFYERVGIETYFTWRGAGDGPDSPLLELLAASLR